MKNLFAKFLLLAGVAGVFASCDKDENDPANYIQIGGTKTEIASGAVSISGDPERGNRFSFAGKGITLDPTKYMPEGKGNMALAGVPAVPGTYTTDADGNITGGYYYNVDFSAAGSGSGIDDFMESAGIMVPGSKITWSKTGDIYTFDMEGSTVGFDEQTPAQYFKLHFSGKLLEVTGPDED